MTLRRHFRQEPGRKRARIGTGLVREIRHLPDRAFQVGILTQIEFLMHAAVVARNLADGFAFIKRAAVKGDGESANVPDRFVMRNEGWWKNRDRR